MPLIFNIRKFTCVNPIPFNNILYQPAAGLFFETQTRSVYFSKCLISIYFFYTPASAKAETCPAW